MDMIKITKEMIPEVETVNVTGKDGTCMVVRKCIPYNAKQIMAYEYSMYVSVTDAENFVSYTSFKDELVKCMLVLKYYTNVDTSDIDTEDDWHMLFDWVMFNGLYYRIMEIIQEDLSIVLRIKDMIDIPARMIFEKANSLEYKVNKAFGSLIGSEDLAKAIAKSDEVNNTMVEMLGAYRDRKNEEKASANKGHISLNNGSIVNVSKKQ